MSEQQYTFTIFTPCYNSAGFIHRVFNSLNSQTYRNFEWIVINDASTDNTAEIIKEYIKTANFKIQFFDLSQNQMLTKNYNLAIKNAKGRFFLPAGHDDEFVAETLETFLAYWNKYGSDEFSGINCLCRDQNGKTVGDYFPESPYFSNYFDVFYNKKIKGEKWGFIRTEVMRQFMLPENIDELIPESLMWAGMGSIYKTIFVNDILRIYYINQSNHQSLTSGNGGKYRYMKGMRYDNLVMINKYLKFITGCYKMKFMYFIKYTQMSINTGLSYRKIISDISGFKNIFVTLLFLPLGYLFSIRDKVKKRL